MVAESIERQSGSVERADRYRTKRALAVRFARHRSAHVLVGGTAVAIVGRALLAGTGVAPFGMADAIATALAVGAVGPVEWIAHKVLFHAPAGSRRATHGRTGLSHRRHHLDPTDLAWVVLAPAGAVALMAAVAVLVGLWVVPVALAASVAIAGPYASALGIGWAAIANYEWTHLLLHSGYRPTSRRYRRLARNHRRHHHRDETILFGVTTGLADRLFGTTRSATRTR